MVLTVLAWPASAKNPYVEDLYNQITDLRPDVTIKAFQPGMAWKDSADIVHVHWPEAAIHPPSTAKAAAKTAAVLADLTSLKARGAKLVWTCHNLKSHDIPHPRLDALLRKRFDRMVDGVIHLSSVSQQGLSSHPVLGPKPSTVVALAQTIVVHDNLPSQAEARQELGIDDDKPVISLIGMIRPYKNVPGLIRAFADMETPAHLVVGGNPLDDSVASELDQAARGVDNLILDARWLTDDEVNTRIRAADVVVLPYTEVHNSSVAVHAASLHRPVAVRPQGSMRGFVDSLGSEWAYSIDKPLTGSVMDDIVEWALKPRDGEPDLSDFDPVETARRTVEFFELLASG